MDNTRVFRSGLWPEVVCFALLGAVFSQAKPAEEPEQNVPRDALGAANAEYQQEALAKLIPEQDVAEVPEGFDPVIWSAFVPEDNAMTPQRVALGRKLYFDQRLSDDGSVS